METEKYRGLKIAAAVSGGMDSMAMLDMLLGAGLNVVRIINFEHGLRGEDSVADSEFVRRYAEERGVNCDVVKLDVKALSARDGIGDEEAARKLRYAYFEELLSSGAADAVATAHHMDDNAETVMQRIFRGTGIRGLKGITDRPGYIHPLSDMTRAEIDRYVREKNIPFRTDKTNLESVYTRNYIRNEIFPVIERRFPGFKLRIARLSETARETDDLLESLKTPGVKREGGIFLPSEAFAAHPAVVKKSISDAIRMLGIYRDVEKRHLDDVMRLASAVTGGRASLQFGIEAVKEWDGVVFYPKGEDEPFEYPFDIGAEYRVGDKVYSFAPTDGIERGVCFDPDKIPADAVFRSRLRGDRFRRAGGGDKSLGDYLTDIKYPVRLRGRLPVIASGNRVYIVLGAEISEEVKTDGNTFRIYKVQIGENEDE